jgi:hypothetical protein
MKKIELGQLLGLLANFGVILGIVFLAVEINQSNRLARLQMRNEIAQSVAGLAFSVATDALAPGLNLRGRDPESLTPEESLRLSLMTTALWRTRENMHYQYENGLFDESEFAAERDSWAGTLSSPWALQFYCAQKHFFSQGYIEVVESMLPSAVCPAAE